MAYRLPGSAPGIEAAVPMATAKPPLLSIIDFDRQQLSEYADASVGQCEAAMRDERTVTWVHVQGRPTLELLKGLERAFGHHSLALEDILSVGQRPKVEEYDDEIFVVVNHPVLTDDGVYVEQVSLFLGPGYVVSFHDSQTDIFEEIRRRLRAGGTDTRIRTQGGDYLLYALLDLIVDTGFPVVDQLGEQLEGLEEQAFESPSRELQSQLHRARRVVMALRKGLGPQRDVLSALLRDEHRLIAPPTRIFLRDCQDHAQRIMDSLDSLRDVIFSTQEVYISSLSSRMNDIMKVLTMIATIFIPLSFITGLYGMNFDSEVSPWNMPELKTYFGYPVLLVCLAAVAAIMLWFFRRRDWL